MPLLSNRSIRTAIRFVFCAAALSLAGCATAPEKPEPRQPVVAPAPEEALAPLRSEIRVGILLPLSGNYGEIGQNLVNAAAMALFDSGNENITLIPADTQGSIAGAAAAAAGLMAQQVDIILGPLLAGDVRAAAAQVQGAVPIIAFSSDTTAASPGVYLLSFPPEGEVHTIIAFARERGHEKFAALVPDTPYGRIVRDAFVEAVVRSGGEVTDVVSFPADSAQLMAPAKEAAYYQERHNELLLERDFLSSLGTDDLAAEILQSLAKKDTLGGVPYDALFIAEGGALVRALAPLLPYYDVDPRQVRFLGTGLWNDDRLLREPPLIGGWFSAPEQDRAQKFMERFRETFRREPPRIATLAYDAMALVAALAQETGRGRFHATRIADPNGFQGVDGIFRFRPDGRVERALAVMTLTKRGFRTMRSAADSFLAFPAVGSTSQFGNQPVEQQPAIAASPQPAVPADQ